MRKLLSSFANSPKKNDGSETAAAKKGETSAAAEEARNDGNFIYLCFFVIAIFLVRRLASKWVPSVIGADF